MMLFMLILGMLTSARADSPDSRKPHVDTFWCLGDLTTNDTLELQIFAASDLDDLSLWQRNVASTWRCPLVFWTCCLSDRTAKSTPFEQLSACYWDLVKTECRTNGGLVILCLLF